MAATTAVLLAATVLLVQSRVPSQPADHLGHAMHYHEVLHPEDFTLQQRQRRDGTIQHHFQFEAYNQTFQIKLEHDEPRFAHGIKVFTVDEAGQLQPYRFNTQHYVKGTVVNHDGDSEARLYINDGFVLGTIIVDDEVFYLEPSRFHYENSAAELLIYARSDLKPDGWRMGAPAEENESFCSCGANSSHNHDHGPEPSERMTQDWYQTATPRPSTGARMRSRRSQASSEFNTCLMTVVADNRLYQYYESSEADVTAVMLNHVEEASRVFRATTFDGLTGLGLAVREVIIESNPASDPFNRASWQVGAMLEQFSLSYTFDRSCLAHLFTRVDFDGGTLGLAWVGSPDGNRQGGICHGSTSQYLNTGLTTNINFGNNVPFATTALVTAHEVGHNWGSSHDSRDPCIPSNAEGGSYLMFAIAVDGAQPNNDKLSPCSISSISSVIAAKGDCFSVPPDGICGNRKLEPGGQDGDVNTVADNEECDAGINGDRCCNSQCQFAQSGAICSPANNACCDIDTCQGFLPSDNEVCFQPFAFDEQCRAQGVCTTISGQPSCENPLPAKPLGSVCGNGGRCTNANADPTTRCQSFCERFGGLACDCDGEDECRTCCKHNPDLDASECASNLADHCSCPFIASDGCVQASTVLGSLSSVSGLDASCYQDRPGDASSEYTVANDVKLDNTCVDTDDQTCQRIFNKLAGTACSIGACNEKGECVTPDTGVAQFWNNIGSLSINDVADWARANIVGAVMLTSFAIWLPVCICIARYDHKQREANAKYGTAKRAAGTLARKHKRHNSRTDAAGHLRHQTAGGGSRPQVHRPSALRDNDAKETRAQSKSRSAGKPRTRPKESGVQRPSKSDRALPKPTKPTRVKGSKPNGDQRPSNPERALPKPTKPTRVQGTKPERRKEPSSSAAPQQRGERQQRAPRGAASAAAAALHSSQDGHPNSGKGPSRGPQARAPAASKGPARRTGQPALAPQQRQPARPRGGSAANQPRPTHGGRRQPQRMDVTRDARESASERNRQALGYKGKPGRLAMDVV
eukprot:m.204011 g.204011  ORF g.204011 m.204011 type:complete len:1035 (+) comp17081_c0_seq2:146-3250(+)